MAEHAFADFTLNWDALPENVIRRLVAEGLKRLPPSAALSQTQTFDRDGKTMGDTRIRHQGTQHSHSGSCSPLCALWEQELEIPKMSAAPSKPQGYAYECMIDGNCRRSGPWEMSPSKQCEDAKRCLAAEPMPTQPQQQDLVAASVLNPEPRQPSNPAVARVVAAVETLVAALTAMDDLNPIWLEPINAALADLAKASPLTGPTNEGHVR